MSNTIDVANHVHNGQNGPVPETSGGEAADDSALQTAQLLSYNFNHRQCEAESRVVDLQLVNYVDSDLTVLFKIYNCASVIRQACPTRSV